MLKTKILLGLILFVSVFSSCKKDDYDAEKQAQIDDQIIADFIRNNNIPAQKNSTGLYYQIVTAGTGDFTYTGSTKVSVNYEGRLLNGSIFDKSSAVATFPLGNLIAGWQIGIPLIQKGGRIRLLIPSTLGYGNQAQGSIPKNAVLDFTIDLINVQ
jgi:FKBP-type peptidyl-prolyl cis-trans isomerase FkpA